MVVFPLLNYSAVRGCGILCVFIFEFFSQHSLSAYPLVVIFFLDVYLSTHASRADVGGRVIAW